MSDTTPTVRTEKAYEVALYGFPHSLINAMRDEDKTKENQKYTFKNGWNMEPLPRNYPDDDHDFWVTYKGKRVMRIGRWHGYGWGCQACYPTLRVSVYKLLKTIMDNQMEFRAVATNRDGKESQIVLNENDYTEL